MKILFLGDVVGLSGCRKITNDLLDQIKKKDIILVSEDRSTTLGFPPYETNIIFWKDNIRYRYKIFLRIGDVKHEDIPVRWLLPSLEDNGEGDCC